MTNRHRMYRRHVAVAVGLLVVTVSVFGGTGSAIGDPTPILVVGGPPGGSVDRAAQLIAQTLRSAPEIPVSVVHEDAVSVADRRSGRLVFLVPAAAVYRGAPVTSDLRPVAVLFATPFVIAVHSSVKVKSLAELVSRAGRDRPYRVAVDGKKTLAALAVRQVAEVAGLPVEIVEFGSYAAAVSAVVGRTADLAAVPVADAINLVARAKLDLLGVTGPVRDALAPEVETFSEQGFFTGTTDWIAMAVLKSVSEFPVRALMSRISIMVMDDAFRSQALRLGLQSRLTDGELASRYWLGLKASGEATPGDAKVP